MAVKSKYFVIKDIPKDNYLLDFVAKEMIIVDNVVMLITDKRYDLTRIQNIVDDLYVSGTVLIGKNVYDAYRKKYCR